MAKQINVDVNLNDDEAKKKLKDLENGKYKVDVDVSNKGADKTTKKINELSNAAKHSQTTFDKLKSTVSNLFSGKNIAFTAYLATLNELRKAANNAKAEIKDLDLSVTDLSVAMGQGRAAALNYLKELNQQGQQIGATTKEVANSADSWLRQGKTAKETSELVYDSMILSKLGQIESADASIYLTSALNGYKKSASEAIDVVDKLTAVDMQSASDAGGLAESMSKTASAADMAGVSIDKLIGMIATVKETTQDSDESVGNMFKSVFSRMNQIKAGKFVDADTGESLNDTEKVLNKVGIAMRDTNGQFISSEKIMDEVGAKWSSFDSVTQRAVATAMAGTYQYNKLIALFNNYSKALDYTKVSAESAGTAIEKFNTSYKDSIEAKTNTLQASFESMILDSDVSKVYANIIDATNALVQFIDKTGALKAALTGGILAGGIKAFATFKVAVNEGYVNLNRFKNSMDIVGKTKVSATNFDRLLNLTSGLSNSQLKLIVSSKALTQAQRTQILMASGLSKEEAKLQLQSWNLTRVNNGLTKSTTSAKNAFSGLWTLIKANPVAVVSTVATAGIMVWQKYNDTIQKIEDSSKELSENLKSSESDISDYKSKVEELQKTIDDSSSSYEEFTDARKQLITIQNELIDKYGTEQSSIKAITDAINGETSAWDKLTKKQWEAAKVDFNSEGGLIKDISNNINGYKDNFDRMKAEYGNYKQTISLGDITGNDKRKQAEELLKNFGTLTKTSAGVGEITLSGNANEVYDQLLKIKELMSDMDVDFGSSFSSSLDKMASSAKNVSDSYKDMYDQYVLNEEILSDTTYKDSFKKISDEYEKYNDALSSGSEEEIKSETQAFVSMITDAMSTAFANGDNDVADYFRTMYPELQAEVDTWEFKVKITPTLDGKDNASYDKELADDFKEALSHFDNADDLLNFNPKASTNDAKKQAYEQLSAIATQDFAGDMESLVDAAVKMYFLQTQGQQDFVNRINGNKNSLPTAGAGNITSDSSSGINLDNSTASNWYGQLSEDEQNIANSDDFVKALQAQSDAMNGAELSANDLDIALQNVKDAASTTTPSLTSFEEAWINLKNTDDDDLKKEADNLLDLAEAGRLTENALEELAGGKKLMEDTGLSSEELSRKINALANSSSQLSALSGQISKMSDMLADKKNGVTASASDLAGFDVEVRGLESWDQFEKVMGDSKSSMEECQEAADALATEWVNSGNYLDKLTDATKGEYETQLKMMGVKNADEVVIAALAEKEEQLRLEKILSTNASVDFENATVDDINKLSALGVITDDEKAKLASYTVAKQYCNQNTIYTVDDCQNLYTLGRVAGATAEVLTRVAAIKQRLANNPIMSNEEIANINNSLNDLAAQISDAAKEKLDIQMSSSGSSGYKDPSGKKSKGSSSKDSKQEINWIDRKLSVLQSKIDLTKSKFDNLFNLTSPKNLKKNIDSVTKSLSSAQSKADSFKKKMSAVKLDDSTKKKIQKGTVKLSDYSKDDQKRIKQYQKYYSSYEKYATKVKNLQKQLNTLNSSRGKINNLETQIKQMKALESATSKAIKKYESYAGKVGLSKSLKNKVKSGDYTITDYDSKTQAKIQKYQDYIDKIAELRQQLQEIQGDIRDTKIQEYQLRADDADAKRSKSEAWTDLERVDNYKKINSHLEYQKKQVKESYKWQIKVAEAEGDSTKASQLRAEREKELRDLTKQEFDAIASAYDYQLKLNDAKRQGIQDALSLAETRGDQIGSAYYSSQISVNNSDLNTRYEERERLLKKLSTMDNGTDEWYSAYDTLQSVNKEISSLINNNAELDRKIKQLKWDRFDELKNKIDDVITEASFLSDLLDSDNFFDDKGMITSDGVTAMGLALQNYDSYLAEAQKYGEQLAELKADYAAGNVSYDDYTSRLREYTQGQQNAIKSANDLKKTTISYVKQGLDAQNEALSKEIEQRKKLLEQEKTERDFNKDVEERSKKIARLQRQIAILENDDSDSNRKTLRELRSNLKDLQDEQDNKFYDKSVSDQEDALNNMLENSKKQAEEYLKDTDKVFADAIVYVNAHADQVSNTLTKLAQDTGYNISEYITKAWRGSGDAIGDYASTMSQNVPKITQQIALITGAWEAQCLAADRAAEASAKAAQGFYSEGSGSGSGNTNNTNNSNSNDDSAKDIKNYITKHLDKAGKSKSYYGVLNQYLYSKTGGKVLSKAEEVQLAKMLGVSVKSDLSGKNDRQKILDALKKKNIKFANGGILGDLVKVSGEDGLFIGSAGESVLTKEQTQALVKLAPVVPQMSNVMDMMKHVVPVNNTNRTENPINIEISNNVNGAVSQEALNEMKKIATNQAETVVKKINSATYAKGVRFR